MTLKYSSVSASCIACRLEPPFARARFRRFPSPSSSFPVVPSKTWCSSVIIPSNLARHSLLALQCMGIWESSQTITRTLQQDNLDWPPQSYVTHHLRTWWTRHPESDRSPLVDCLDHSQHQAHQRNHYRRCYFGGRRRSVPVSAHPHAGCFVVWSDQRNCFSAALPLQMQLHQSGIFRARLFVFELALNHPTAQYLG